MLKGIWLGKQRRPQFRIKLTLLQVPGRPYRATLPLNNKNSFRGASTRILCVARALSNGFVLLYFFPLENLCASLLSILYSPLTSSLPRALATCILK
jgi:hypothetical protein